MDDDYCIENDLPRQQEMAMITKMRRDGNLLALTLRFEAVFCGVGNLLKNTKDVPTGVGGQILTDRLQRAVFRSSDVERLYDALILLQSAVTQVCDAEG